MDEKEQMDSTPDSPAAPRNRRRKAVAIAAAIILVAGVAAGGLYLSQNRSVSSTQNAPIAEKAKVETTVPADKPCEHDWTVTYKTVRHAAVTHTENVAPVYQNKTAYHTVCNDCQQVIDGIADQHIKDTGHSGYSTNVPITGEVLVSEGYSHEVTDSPAFDESVPDKLVCTLCGAEKPATAE